MTGRSLSETTRTVPCPVCARPLGLDEDTPQAVWAVYRFQCPWCECEHACEVADHGRRDPASMFAGRCPEHLEAMEFVEKRPLYGA